MKPFRDHAYYNSSADGRQTVGGDVRRTPFSVIAVALIATFVACAAIVLSAYGASPVRRNAATTVAYLHARASFVRDAIADTVHAGVRLQHLAREASIGCPKIVTASPLEPETVERVQGDGFHRAGAILSDRTLVVQQVSTAVEDALHQGRAGAFARFAVAVKRLRWRNAAVERHVQASVRSEAEAQRQAIPKLCREMRLWVRSGFRRTPNGFLRRHPTIVGVDINGPLPNPRVLLWPGALDAYALLGSLEPLLGGHQKLQLMGVRQLQTKLILDEMRAFRWPANDILHALGFYSHGALFAKMST